MARLGRGPIISFQLRTPGGHGFAGARAQTPTLSQRHPKNLSCTLQELRDIKVCFVTLRKGTLNLQNPLPSHPRRSRQGFLQGVARPRTITHGGSWPWEVVITLRENIRRLSRDPGRMSSCLEKLSKALSVTPSNPNRASHLHQAQDPIPMPSTE